ncbi:MULTISPECIES: EamA family transporter [Cohnella]|uniref:EamA family transporter n=1 Tax=Cohnella TaxID=329857 RepID=UPI001F087083|nr:MULTISPECIES: EamA family transporter [Cohnella]
MIAIIFFILLTGASGPPLIKYGAMKETSRISALANGDILAGLAVIFNPYILIGLFMYFVSALLWIIVLSKYDLSFVNPLLSVNYIFSLVIGYYVFQEAINMYRILGVFIIVAGVVLITLKG